MKTWREVAGVAAWETRSRVLAQFEGGRHAVVFKVGDEYFAVGEFCSHEQAAMAIAQVKGHEIICPLHGARFDLRTGRPLSPPATRPLAVYPVKVEEGKVWVKI